MRGPYSESDRSPNNPVVLNAVSFGELPHPTAVREQHAVLATLGKGECEGVVIESCGISLTVARARWTLFDGSSTTLSPPRRSKPFCAGGRGRVRSSNSASGIGTSYGKSRKASSNAAFLRSIRQLLSLTVRRIGVLRTVQACLHFRKGCCRQFRTLRERDQVLCECAVARALESCWASALSLLIERSDLFPFLCSPAASDHLVGIGER